MLGVTTGHCLIFGEKTNNMLCAFYGVEIDEMSLTRLRKMLFLLLRKGFCRSRDNLSERQWPPLTAQMNAGDRMKERIVT